MGEFGQNRLQQVIFRFDGAGGMVWAMIKRRTEADVCPLSPGPKKWCSLWFPFKPPSRACHQTKTKALLQADASGLPGDKRALPVSKSVNNAVQESGPEASVNLGASRNRVPLWCFCGFPCGFL